MPVSAIEQELLDFGFDGSNVRLKVIAEFLQSQDFDTVASLARAPPLAALPGAILLQLSELEFLTKVSASATRKWEVSLTARPTSECASFTLLPDDGNAFKRVANAMQQSQALAVSNVGVGPRQALKRLKAALPDNSSKCEWLQQARLNAILGGSAKSRASFVSGLRNYLEFASAVLNVAGNELPPLLDHLLAWSILFRSAETFSNYLGYVRLACDVVDVSGDVFAHPALRRAKRSIKKRCDFQSRERLFLRLTVVRDMVISVLAHPERVDLVMLFLFSYIFLLRLPSEALPTRLAGSGNDDGSQSVVQVTSDAIVLRLASRKNKPHGSVLRRRCWCKDCASTCPVHVLGPYLSKFRPGQQPFADFTAATALSLLRELLVILEVPNAHLYRTHDLRRGHARDLQARGASLAEILRAGDWRSASFLKYLDLMQLEEDAVLEAHVCESSSGDE